jgi:hypothetical protein
MTVKSELISSDINRDPVLAPLVNRASQLLNAKTRLLSHGIHGEWRLGQDAGGNRHVVLTLQDDTGASSEARFTPEELADIRIFHPRLYSALGDLLERRSHLQLDIISGKTQVG